ncbi:MAG: two-component regulator propeller domain-containing protein [Bacteroidales bacterium]|nr:two-component regulator propeller domain-containing protein [Bacteroidales bacterium]
MNILKQAFAILFVGSIAANAFTQEAGVGQWRDHLPFNSFIAVTESGNEIYGATPYAVLRYNKTDESIERFNKINGLSDIGISDIKYNPGLQTTVIAYTNTNIDLFKDNYIVNMPDIKRKPILGNKVINQLTMRGNYAYLSCGFGIVVLDLQGEEVFDTWYIGAGGSQINVFDVAYNDTAYFAATEEGIYYAAVNHPNLADYAAWKRMNNAPFPMYAYNMIESFAGKIIVNTRETGNDDQDSIFYYDGVGWASFPVSLPQRLNNINATNGKLVLALAYSGKIYNSSLEEELTIYTYNPGNPQMNDAIYLADGSVWVADQRNGLVKSFNEGWESMKINPGGPNSANVFSMTAYDNKVWVAPGGYTSTWSPLFLNYGTYRFWDESWKNYNASTNPELSSIRDIVTIAVNPANSSQTYFGVFRNEYGLLEMNGEEITDMYNTENSELQLWEAAGKIALVGLGFDSQGSLWALCSGAEKLLAEKKNDGSWASYGLGGSAAAVDCSELFIDSYDQKWVVFRHTNSNPNYIAVYNENNPPGDQLRLLRSESGVGNIPGTNVFSIAEDQDGEVWIGTDEGIGIFYSPSTILSDQDYDAVRPLVNFDGYVQYLLETEVVTAIAIDGDNRKWIGTERSGVFLLSQDGTNQIAHFTEDNSPLFSDQIIDIVINEDGEVIIATSSGIIGYRGTASAPNESYSDVYAYPNPVKDGYDGWIAVKGLMKDSDVKITDINGTLIYATRSEGGQAVWDGKNFDGRKARPGVYLVFAATEDGAETMVTKILVID